jgi:predicted dehydrogenase
VSGNAQLGFESLAVTKDEPLKLEVDSFLDAVQTRKPAAVSGEEGLRALEVALAILGKIEEHTRIVAEQLKTLA